MTGKIGAETPRILAEAIDYARQGEQIARMVEYPGVKRQNIQEKNPKN